MTRPSFINELDWRFLIEKYHGTKLERVVKKIENNYPVQYAIGNVDFLDCNFIVNKNVLIPRFETEYLVDNLKKYIDKYEFKSTSILDLCTGSGCIGISLKKAYPTFDVFCVDKSIPALLVAHKNAKRNGQKVKLIRRDILKNKVKGKYSIIVSNPPYLTNKEFVTPNTKYEPNMALYTKKSDIEFYTRILDMSKDILYPKNIIAFEIGSNQAKRICNYAKKIYKNANIVVSKDYNDLDRFIFIINNCE